MRWSHEVEQRWFYTIFLQVLGRYLHYKHSLGAIDEMYAYAQSSLLLYARWMVDGLNEMFLGLGIDPNGPAGVNLRGGLPVLGLAMKFVSAPALHETVTHQIAVTRIGGLAG